MSPADPSPEVWRALKAFGLRDFSWSRLPGDGSSRRFFRVFSREGSYILILPQPGAFGLQEARAYATIGRFLAKEGIPVPEIYLFEEKSGLILVEDLGDQRLEDLPLKGRLPFYEEAISLLVYFQELVTKFDHSWAIEGPYGPEIMWKKEALYFVEAFVEGYLGLSFPEEALKELYLLWKEAQDFLGEPVLLHRDFQSRNLMIKEGRIRLIDFQGTRFGPAQYDLASLLIDPYASLSQEEQEYLFKYYLSLRGRKSLEGFSYFSLFRNLQILGAFGKLTKSGKEWFQNYIPQAWQGLHQLLKTHFPHTRHFLAFVEKIEPFAMV